MNYLIKKINELNDRSLNYGEAIIRSWLGEISFEDVLDVGAGNGRDLEIIKSLRDNINIGAIENFKPSIEILKKEEINISSIDIEKEEFPYEKESLDLVIANQVLEHCKEIFWIHHEIFRTLKVGGHLIIGVPNLAAYYNRINLALNGKQPYCISLDGAHIRGFTKDGYQKFLKNIIRDKYVIKSFKGANFVPFPSKIARILARFFPNSSTCIFFLIEKKKAYEQEFLKAPKGLATPFWLGK